MRVQAGIVEGLFGAVPPVAARWSGRAVVQLSHLLLLREGSNLGSESTAIGIADV